MDISVPARTDGRLSEHTERWSMCRLLASLAADERLSYPVSLVHDDRPDFLLKSSRTEFGVEVTEAIPEGFAAYCALAEREFPNDLLDIGLFRPGSPSYSINQMREFLRTNKLSSRGWDGNSVEHEWADYIKETLEKKLARLAQDSFRKYQFNWLSIYDNLPRPNLHLGDAMPILWLSLEGYWLKSPSFDRIFIESGRSIICLSADGWEQIALKDLWSRKSIDDAFKGQSDQEPWDEIWALNNAQGAKQ